MSKRKSNYKLNIGKKPIADFLQHSLKNYHEIQTNPNAQKLLIQVNLYYSTYQSTPPAEYLQFVLKNLDMTIDQIKRCIQYLAHYEWFSIVKSKQKFTYHLTDKFRKTFCHGTWRIYEKQNLA